MSEQTKAQNTIWMPKQEHDLMMQHLGNTTQEQRIEQTYFFWNNFSMDGYEEWRESQSAEVRNT